MSNPITNRYDFVVYFDVENGTLMETLMRVICRASTLKLGLAWSLMYA